MSPIVSYSPRCKLLYHYLKNSGELLIVGYPGMELFDSISQKPRKPSEMLLKPGEYEFFRMAIPGTKNPDEIHWWVDQKKYRIGRSTKGYSGSPFYVQDQKSGKWRIAGIFSDAEDSVQIGGGIAIVKIEYAIEWINQYLRRKESK